VTNLPVSTIDPGVSVDPGVPVADEDGFTLVEEDDVAFTLALCREIHRLYGSYEDNELPADEAVWAGLDLTRQMVSTLQSSVTSGMPSMRLQVAAAQVREMLAVLFADEPVRQKSGIRGGGQETRLDQPARPAALAPLAVPVPTAVPAQLPTAVDAPPPSRPESYLPPPESTWPGVASDQIVTEPHQSRTVALWNDLPVVVRLITGVVLCCVAGALLNVPVVIMALFPNHLTIIGIVYAAIGLRVWQWHPGRFMPWARSDLLADH
jgi:hypothetical protein